MINSDNIILVLLGDHVVPVCTVMLGGIARITSGDGLNGGTAKFAEK